MQDFPEPIPPEWVKVVVEQYELDAELVEKFQALLNVEPVRDELIDRIRTEYRRYFGDLPAHDLGDG